MGLSLAPRLQCTVVVARDVDGVAFPGVSAFFVYCLVSFEDLVWPSNTGTNFRGYSYLGSRFWRRCWLYFLGVRYIISLLFFSMNIYSSVVKIHSS